MIHPEDLIIIVKNTRAASIKCNTYCGYIGWSSCDNICMDMQDCVDMCAEHLKSGDALTALKASVYILFSGVKLVSCADSSSARDLIEELRRTYPRRTALLDELGKVEKKL